MAKKQKKGIIRTYLAGKGIHVPLNKKLTAWHRLMYVKLKTKKKNKQ